MLLEGRPVGPARADLSTSGVSRGEDWTGWDQDRTHDAGDLRRHLDRRHGDVRASSGDGPQRGGHPVERSLPWAQ